MFLHSSQVSVLFFHVLWTFFFHLCFSRSSLLIHGGLLPSLLDYLLLGMYQSWAWCRRCLNINQLSSALSFEVLSWLMVLVAEHSYCVKKVWTCLQRIISSHNVVSKSTDTWVGSGTNWNLNLRTSLEEDLLSIPQDLMFLSMKHMLKHV